MAIKDYSQNPAALLAAILEKCIGNQLTAIVYNSDYSQVRLDMVPAVAATVGIIRLVLTGKPQVYFLSYLQIVAQRERITEPKRILENNLLLQGAAAPEKQKIILYCGSLNKVAAGELHLSFSNFTLFDEHYGKLDPFRLIKA